MSDGARLIASLPLKAEFYDSHERRAYARAVEIARRIVDDPTLIENARRFMDIHMKPDPHQRSAYDAWSVLLEHPAADIARALLADTPAGAELRGNAPVFVTIESTRPTR